jgi:hypothetical protein
MTETVPHARRFQRRGRGSRPSIREVALVGQAEAATWSPGQCVAWAGRSYIVAGRPGDGPAHLRLASCGGV